MHDTIFKKSFSKDIIISRIEYLNKIKSIFKLELGKSILKEDLEKGTKKLENIVNESKFKVLFNIRNCNVKTIRSMMGIINTVFDCFGFELKIFRQGTSNNRTIKYIFQRIDILEEYVKNNNNNFIIDM